VGTKWQIPLLHYELGKNPFVLVLNRPKLFWYSTVRLCAFFKLESTHSPVGQCMCQLVSIRFGRPGIQDSARAVYTDCIQASGTFVHMQEFPWKRRGHQIFHPRRPENIGFLCSTDPGFPQCAAAVLSKQDTTTGQSCSFTIPQSQSERK
jgi:hypothetical protein